MNLLCRDLPKIDGSRGVLNEEDFVSSRVGIPGRGIAAHERHEPRDDQGVHPEVLKVPFQVGASEGAGVPLDDDLLPCGRSRLRDQGGKRRAIDKNAALGIKAEMLDVDEREDEGLREIEERLKFLKRGR